MEDVIINYELVIRAKELSTIAGCQQPIYVVKPNIYWERKILVYKEIIVHKKMITTPVKINRLQLHNYVTYMVNKRKYERRVMETGFAWEYEMSLNILAMPFDDLNEHLRRQFITTNFPSDSSISLFNRIVDRNGIIEKIIYLSRLFKVPVRIKFSLDEDVISKEFRRILIEIDHSAIEIEELYNLHIKKCTPDYYAFTRIVDAYSKLSGKPRNFIE